MSRPTSRPAVSDAVPPAGPALFDTLIDDAAVFPPGSAPLPTAISDHRCLRQSPASVHVGPLLVPASAVSTLLDLVGDPADPLTIGLIGAPGDTGGLIAAVELAERRSGLTVSGAEIALNGREVADLVRAMRPLTDRGRSIAVEVPRDGADELAALAAHHALLDAGLLRGKYRTGGVDPGAVPPSDRLAAILTAAAGHRLPIKLTAGLHHAVRTAEQHGVLNVLAAARWALEGADTDTVRAELDRPDPTALTAELGSWTVERARAVRGLFTTFGCCGVLEPLTEAARLGLIPPVAHDLTAPEGTR